MRIGEKDSRGFRYVGNLSAVDPAYSIELSCDACAVFWIGCFDANCCPECGDGTDWLAHTAHKYAPSDEESE
jgi:hypothetical protein